MKKLFCLCAVISAFGATPAEATIFGFAGDHGGAYVSQGYQGFNYSGGYGNHSWVNDTAAPIDSSYGVGPAALGAAWSNGGTPLSMTSATPGAKFDIASLSLDAGWTENVTIQGFLNGSLIDSWTGLIKNSYTYTDVKLDWTGLDRLTLSGGANLFVTNINTSVGNHVPEPTTFALLGLGLAGLGWNRRRKAS